MTSDKDQNSKMPVSDWPEWQWFDSIEKFLKDVLVQAEKNKTNNEGILYPFLDSVIESLDSLRILAYQHKLRDSYVIARVVYETSVNACFILTATETLSSRASRHAKQKALRNLVRELALAGSQIFEFKVQHADEILGDPRHQEWLMEFTSKSGREITAWTPENVQQRLEAICLKFGHDATRGLAFGLLLYRHASEIAHGSLFGTLFSWGAMEPFEPLKSPSDIGKFREQEIRFLLKMVCFSIESVIRIVGPALGIPEDSLSVGEARMDYYRQRKANA